MEDPEGELIYKSAVVVHIHNGSERTKIGGEILITDKLTIKGYHRVSPSKIMIFSVGRVKNKTAYCCIYRKKSEPNKIMVVLLTDNRPEKEKHAYRQLHLFYDMGQVLAVGKNLYFSWSDNLANVVITEPESLIILQKKGHERPGIYIPETSEYYPLTLDNIMPFFDTVNGRFVALPAGARIKGKYVVRHKSMAYVLNEEHLSVSDKDDEIVFDLPARACEIPAYVKPPKDTNTYASLLK